MKLTLPFPEALSLATAQRPLPAIIRSVDCLGETLHAEVDLDALPTNSIAVRLAAAAAGTVTVTARLLGYADGVATFGVTAHVRTMPAHKLLPYLLGSVNKAIRDSGLPEGLLQVQSDSSGPLVLVELQKAVETKVKGVTITDLELRDAVIRVEAVIDAVTLL